jgi:inhibitor of KinA sporulation pathway (predicted exonuclease)
MYYLIIDLEATCKQERDRNFQTEIIEIGAVLVKDKQIISEFNQFVRPTENRTLTDFCKNLTSITQEQVDSAQTLVYALSNLKAWLYNLKIESNQPDLTFCSWGDYDRNQLLRETQRKRINYPFNDQHINIKKRFANKFNCKPCGVDKAVQIMGWQFEGTHHRGIDDAKNITKLFMEIL